MAEKHHLAQKSNNGRKSMSLQFTLLRQAITHRMRMVESYSNPRKTREVFLFELKKKNF